MTNQEAIDAIKANYPDERYAMLREALDMAMELLKAQELPDVKPEKLEERTTKWLDQMTAEERLKEIAAILDDWDGYRTAKGLGGLINEVWAYALYPVKAQEPRVMTVKELEETKDPVFIELRTKGEDDKALTCFGLLSEWDDLLFHFIIDQWLLDGEPFARFYGCELKRKEYCTEWRPWNKRPTKERMKEEKWDIQDTSGLQYVTMDQLKP